MSIPITSPFNYLGVFLFISGAFLVLSGLNIIKVEKITVQSGRPTLILGIVSTVIGLVFLIVGQGSPALAEDGHPSPTSAQAGIPVAGQNSQGSPVSMPASATPTFPAGVVATRASTPEGGKTIGSLPTIDLNRVPTPMLTDTPSRVFVPTRPPAANYLATIQAMPLTLTDNFSDNHNNWFLKNYEDDFAVGSNIIQNGVLIKQITSKQPNITSRTLNFNMTDFWLSVEANVLETTADPGDAGVAVTFRDDKNSNYYEVIFSMNGYYHFSLYRENSAPQTLVDWTEIPGFQIEVGVPVRLGLLVHGSQYVIFVNGEAVGTLDDANLPGPGAIGLGASLFSKPDYTLKVSFDNLEIREMQ